jgi:hypothetical protein
MSSGGIFVVNVGKVGPKGIYLSLQQGRIGLRVKFQKNRGQNANITLRLFADVGSRSYEAEND